MEQVSIIETGYEYNEATLLSIITENENIESSAVDKIFRYVPEFMLIDTNARRTYKLIQELYSSEDRELLGTKHFTNKLKMIAEIEHPGLEKYISGLGLYWAASATVNYWINKIHKQYFSIRYRNAQSKEEYFDILAQEQEYAMETDMVSIADDADPDFKEYEKSKQAAVFTSYPSINRIIGSFAGGDMVVLAGASSSGKTCMMLNLVTGIAKMGKKVDIFSLEMTRRQLQQRIVCSEAGIDASKFKSFTLSDEDKKKYRDYVQNEFKKLDIRLFKKQAISIEYIKTIEMKSDADIVFIDYLGLINSYNNKSPYDRFSEISRNIKLLAITANKPIVALHQLNRDFQNRDDKKPKNSDLRDSGKIEQDADIICFTYRPAQFDANCKDVEDMRFIVTKNRQGEANKEARLIFNGINQRITEPIIVRE